MIRLTAILVAALGGTMYFADEIVGPSSDTAAIPVAAVLDVTPLTIEPAPAAKPEPILASLTVQAGPQPVRSAPVEVTATNAVLMVPFDKPAVVMDDGTLQFEPVKVALNETPKVQDIVEEVKDVRYVSATRVNVRSGPSTDFGVIGSVAFADAVSVIADANSSWVQIRIEGDGVEGYMAGRFLQDVMPNR